MLMQGCACGRSWDGDGDGGLWGLGGGLLRRGGEKVRDSLGEEIEWPPGHIVPLSIGLKKLGEQVHLRISFLLFFVSVRCGTVPVSPVPICCSCCLFLC